MFDTISHVLPELSGVSRSKSKTIEQFRVLQQSGMDSICYIPPFQMDNNNTWGEAVQKKRLKNIVKMNLFLQALACQQVTHLRSVLNY